MNPDSTPRAIFLDLDDTIVDDSSSIDSAWVLACREATAATPRLDSDDLRAAILTVRDWYWSDPERHRIGRQDLRAASTWIVDQALSRLGLTAPGLAAVISNRYRDLREDAIALLPGAVDAIEAFRSAGIRLALLTNGSSAMQRAKIDRFDLARHFDYVCVEGEFGCGKPDQRVYRAALDALGSSPQETWMVGDNLEWDVLAPKRLGLTGIWLDRFATGLPAAAPAAPDRVILRLDELL